MNLGKYLFGIREEYFHQATNDERKEQFISYNLLAAMFWVLVSLSFIAGMCYGLVIFQSWVIAIFIGLFLGLISFILILLILFLNMTTRYSDLYDKMTNMHLVYREFEHHDFSNISDEQAQSLVQDYKIKLRNSNQSPGQSSYHLSGIFTSSIKVIVILILSCTVANGLEFLIFRQKLNESLQIVRDSPILQKTAAADSTSALYSDERKAIAKWTLEMLNERSDQPFILIDSYSVLQSIELLETALGKWKVIFDFLFALLYLIPFIIVKKSKRYAGGAYLKEQALSDITTSFMFWILMKRKCAQVKSIIETEFDYQKFSKAN
jgi:hypothetical protein